VVLLSELRKVSQRQLFGAHLERSDDCKWPVAACDAARDRRQTALDLN
jgi:hypothetical protein